MSLNIHARNHSTLELKLIGIMEKKMETTGIIGIIGII